MNRKQYRELAKRHGVSVGEIKREMDVAIRSAYDKPNKTFAEAKAQAEIPKTGKYPNRDALIEHLANKIRNG